MGRKQAKSVAMEACTQNITMAFRGLRAPNNRKDEGRVSSAEVFAQPKRPTEKYLTARVYNRLRFVEDLVREVAMKMRERLGAAGFSLN